MKFPALRRYIRSKNETEPYILKNCNLVIDAHSFFRDSYKESGCQFVLGPDCDRYADYLIGKLTPFLEHKIKLHVIFKGKLEGDLEKIQTKHQLAIDDMKNIEFNLDKPKYFDPLFVTDIQKQVLDEMGIKYFCCEYDLTEAIISVARVLKCPVVTNNIEFCLFKVSCIVPDSILYKNNILGVKELKCYIYEHHKQQAILGLFIKTPVFLTALNKNCAVDDDIQSVIRWTKQQKKKFDASNTFKDENMVKLYNKINILFSFPSNLAINYFRRGKSYGLFKDDKKWFSKGVATGRIGLPYVDVKRKNRLLGSKIVNDVNKPDAILAADKIIAYNHQLLTNSQESTLSFIGRKGKSSCLWEIDTSWPGEINNREIFVSHKKTFFESKHVYVEFFKGILPKHDLIKVILSHGRIPQSCWILVMSLVYYVDNVNEDFIDGAYFIILSYLMLGPVSLAIDKGPSVVGDATYQAAKNMYDKLQFLFRKVDLKNDFNICILHSLSEFQHCLQHMNYLNDICGKVSHRINIPSTVYQDTYNATFIYNIFIIMRNKDNLLKYLKEQFEESHVFFNLYNGIISGFELCRHPSEIDEDKLVLSCSYKHLIPNLPL